MVASTKVLCPRFDKIEILIPGDSPGIFLSLDKILNYNLLQKRRNMTLLKQFIKLELMRRCEWMCKGAVSIPLVHEGFKQGPAKLRDWIRIRIGRSDSIKFESDGPIQKFRIAAPATFAVVP